MTGARTWSFTLDRFQLDAFAAIERGESVLVAAPTGSGKTVVAEHAIDLALAAGRKVFYTAPIKALSNQKFRDLGARLGPERVGLLTGDHSINGEAPVVVMTTEVLRNMLYAGSPTLTGLAWVILDEVHYLEDRYRGPVWEEVILNLPREVTLVCLSATVSNSDEIADWLGAVRGPTTRVVETRRPVKLEALEMIADRTSDRLHLVPVLVDGRPNRDGFRFDVDPRVGFRSQRGRRRGGERRPSWATPRRLDVLDELERRGLLPAITFVFSRAGCEEAAAACHRAGVRLTDADERVRLRAIAEAATGSLDDDDLATLGYEAWLAVLESGIAAHHAGMVPPFKDAVERGFAEGLVKMVFATETLALGVNLPARSVVIEKLTKFTGEAHEALTPSQFTQLTGRAGRRGIDELGTAIVLWSPFVPFGRLAALAASTSFELRSAFRPTYNMAVNLVDRVDREAAEDLLGRSLGQFQLDRAVAGLHARLDRARRELRRAEADVADQRAELEQRRERQAEDRRSARTERAAAADRLRPGDVVVLADRRLAVLAVAHRRGGRTQLRLVDTRGDRLGLSLEELPEPPEARGRIDLPEPFAPNNAAFLGEVGRRLRQARLSPRRGSRRPPAGHDGGGLKALERLERAEASVARLERRARSREGTLVHRFEAVLEVLGSWGYVDGWGLTDRGRLLRGVFHERDLLVAETLASGDLDGLAGADLAGVISVFTFEARSSAPAPLPWYPDAEVRSRVEAIVARALRLATHERTLGLPETAIPDPGFIPYAHAWVLGAGLGDLLEPDDGPSPGDFVRNVKQVIDLLGQIAEVAPDPRTRATAIDAVAGLDRGVVAAASRLGGTDVMTPRAPQR